MITQTLAGRTAIVTGGSKGIGKGIARALGLAGAQVLIVGRDGNAAENTSRQLSSQGIRVSACAADVTNAADVNRIARTATELFGGIDIVCCNAGVYPQSTLADMTPAELQHVLAVNLVGSILIVQASLPELRKSGHGRVILTSSITGPITGMAGFSHYAASKAGQLGFMRAAAVELAPDLITVNAVLPGNIVTEGFDELGAEYRRSMEQSVPIGRLGNVDDIGQAVVYLASPSASFVTGHALVVDGGQTLPESLSY